MVYVRVACLLRASDCDCTAGALRTGSGFWAAVDSDSTLTD